ncbi:hypothetical protein QUA56_30920 [Microcoleus sp. N3A4]|uniref:hypothetical protein n=1 Tax=Microcoleus sp. N3A4 TaxID=3055379 RepID=UPI002FD29E59
MRLLLNSNASRRSLAMIFHRNFDQLSLKDGILVGVGRSSSLIRFGLPHKVLQGQALLKTRHTT